MEKFSGKVKENYNENINGNYSAFSHNTEVTIALEELKFAIRQLHDGENRIELKAQNSFIRRMQHKSAAKEGINSVVDCALFPDAIQKRLKFSTFIL